MAAVVAHRPHPELFVAERREGQTRGLMIESSRVGAGVPSKKHQHRPPTHPPVRVPRQVLDRRRRLARVPELDQAVLPARHEVVRLAPVEVHVPRRAPMRHLRLRRRPVVSCRVVSSWAGRQAGMYACMYVWACEMGSPPGSGMERKHAHVDALEGAQVPLHERGPLQHRHLVRVVRVPRARLRRLPAPARGRRRRQPLGQPPAAHLLRVGYQS